MEFFVCWLVGIPVLNLGGERKLSQLMISLPPHQEAGLVGCRYYGCMAVIVVVAVVGFFLYVFPLLFMKIRKMLILFWHFYSTVLLAV